MARISCRIKSSSCDLSASLAHNISMSDGFLFNEHDVYGVVEARKLSVKKKIQSIPASTILGASEADLFEALSRSS